LLRNFISKNFKHKKLIINRAYKDNIAGSQHSLGRKEKVFKKIMIEKVDEKAKSFDRFGSSTMPDALCPELFWARSQ
jgi:hypothetical protein